MVSLSTLPSSAPDRSADRSTDQSTDQLVNPGQLIVVSGPSGVGKGTLLQLLRSRHPNLKVSVSATTRSPRAGEVNGQHYHFVSKPQFLAMVEAGELLEWAEFAGNCYGTPKAPIEEAIAQGERVLLEIELLGARQVRETFPAGRQIFIAPPSVETLEARIRNRGQEDEGAIAKRLAQSQVELAAADEFDIQIINDQLEVALEDLESAVFKNA